MSNHWSIVTFVSICFFYKIDFKDLNFVLRQFFNFSQNIYTSFFLFYISKLYEFLFFCLLVDNQVTAFFKKFRNGYFHIELSILKKAATRSVLCKKVFLEISQNSFLIQLQASKPPTLLKKRLWHWCFPMNFVKFVRTPFLQNNSGRLLLITPSSNHIVYYSHMTFLVILHEM